jgi:hypothetical protein
MHFAFEGASELFADKVGVILAMCGRVFFGIISQTSKERGEAQMPAIRITHSAYKDKRTGAVIPEKEEWVRIHDQHMDDDGYLQLFTVFDGDDVPRAMHLIRHDVSLMSLAISIFDAGKDLRSGKGLLEDLAKLARKEKWVGKAGPIGIAFASAAILHEFLKTKPFHKEGYYRADGTLFLGRKIHSKTKNDYDPRQSDRD